MKIWIFPTLAFVWPSKIVLAFFQFSRPSDILNIQNYSNLNYFEAILPLKQFLLKNWQTGSVWASGRRAKHSGPAEDRGMVGIRLHLLLAVILTLFHPRGALCVEMEFFRFGEINKSLL